MLPNRPPAPIRPADNQLLLPLRKRLTTLRLEALDLLRNRLIDERRHDADTHPAGPPPFLRHGPPREGVNLAESAWKLAGITCRNCEKCWGTPCLYSKSDCFSKSATCRNPHSGRLRRVSRAHDPISSGFSLLV